MSKFIEDFAVMVNKTVDELNVEFEEFKEELSQRYKGRLSGDKLEGRAQGLFSQRYRAERVDAENSPAKAFYLRIMGISDVKDGVSYVRKDAAELYETNPNKFVMEGRINEYTEVDDGILKRYHDHFDRTDPEAEGYEIVKEVMVEKMPETAVPYGEDTGVFIAPVDVNEFGFGGKGNKDYGIEYPLHKYSRYVYGVGEPQAGGDAKWTRLMLRGDQAVMDMPEINKSYVVRALSFSKDGDAEHHMISLPKATSFTETEWNPFGDNDFVESVMEADFMKKKTVLLGEAEDYLKKVEAAKDARTFKDWNDAIMIEVDVMDMYPNLDPEKDWSDKLIVDDPSLRADFNLDKIQSNVTAWVSKSNTIDFGTDSRVLLTCYPTRGRKAEGETVGPLRLSVYGMYAFEDMKTDFNIEDFKKEDL